MNITVPAPKTLPPEQKREVEEYESGVRKQRWRSWLSFEDYAAWIINRHDMCTTE